MALEYQENRLKDLKKKEEQAESDKKEMEMM